MLELLHSFINLSLSIYLSKSDLPVWLPPTKPDKRFHLSHDLPPGMFVLHLEQSDASRDRGLRPSRPSTTVGFTDGLTVEWSLYLLGTGHNGHKNHTPFCLLKNITGKISEACCLSGCGGGSRRRCQQCLLGCGSLSLDGYW